MSRGVPCAEIFSELVVAPAANTRNGIGRNVVDAPAGERSAGELAAIIERLAEVARGMTVATVPEGFHQVGSTVPLGAAVFVRLEPLIRVVEHRPDPHQPTLVEGEPQGVGRWSLMHNRQTEEVGLDG